MVELFDKAKRVFGIFGLVAVLGVVIYAGYLSNSTQPVKNYNNKTGEMVNPALPPTAIIIPDFIDTGEYITLMLIFAAVIFAVLRSGGLENDWISAEEAAKAVDVYYKKMRERQIPFFMWNRIDFNISCYLSWTRFVTGEPTPKRWVVWSKVSYQESTGRPSKYIKTYVYPYKKEFQDAKIMGTVISEAAPTDKDICSKCGSEYNERPIVGPDLQQWIDTNKERVKVLKPKVR